MTRSRELRFNNELGEVETCACGGFNLTLGAVTLHLEADEVPHVEELVLKGRALTEERTQRKSKRKRRAAADSAGGTFH